MNLDPDSYLPPLMVIIAGIVWAVRLEGRVNSADQRFKDLKEDIDYIRERIDRALNGNH